MFKSSSAVASFIASLKCPICLTRCSSIARISRHLSSAQSRVSPRFVPADSLWRFTLFSRWTSSERVAPSEVVGIEDPRSKVST